MRFINLSLTLILLSVIYTDYGDAGNKVLLSAIDKERSKYSSFKILFYNDKLTLDGAERISR